MQIAERMQGISGSAIRELFKLLGDPAIISFGGGNPSKACFPGETIRTITDELLREKSDILLQYGATEGYMPLRRAYLDYILPDNGLHGELDNVLALTGSMQGLDLICKAVINPGDTVLVEEPSFLGALQTFRVAQAKLVTVPMHSDGVHIDELEAAVKAHRPKVFYTIPTFQNPSGYVTSVETRKRIAELAAEYDMLVIEDDPYAALRFSGEKLPTIDGTPPNLFNKITGDAFAPRNEHALKIDFVEEPPFFKVSDTHYAKTWLLDPRAPKLEKPEVIQNLHEKIKKMTDKGGAFHVEQ